MALESPPINGARSGAQSNARKARLLLAGSPAFATEVFMPLIHSGCFEIIGLLAQPDKPFGRKAELKAPHTKEALQHLGFPILQPQRIDSELIAQVAGLEPDIILVVAYGKLLPKAFLDIAPCVNIHASILPHLRGASPLQQMILEQPKFFGISAMKINEGLDSGEILALSYLPNTAQNLPRLSSDLAKLGGALALKVLLCLPYIAPLRQNHAQATFCQKIKKSDGEVSFDLGAERIYRAALAYDPWPGIFVKSPSGYSLKLFDIGLCEVSEMRGNAQSGEILAIEKSAIVLACGEGAVRIGSVQQEGKSRLEAATYARGKRLAIGDMLC